MGRNGGGISANMVPRRRSYRDHCEIFTSQFERFGDRLCRGSAFGDMVGHSPVPPPPLCYRNFECPDGPAACGGGLDRLSAFVALRSVWGPGAAVYTCRHDHCPGDYHHASDCFNHASSHARAVVGLS